MGKKNKKDTGEKFDQGKLRYDLIDGYALQELASIYTFGAQKYADNNWRKGLLYSRVFGALLRHVWAWWMGEDNDPETGLSHMAHAAWNCMTLASFSQPNVDRYKEFDDRGENR